MIRLDWIEKHYYQINTCFLLALIMYCMAGLIVPLQFLSAHPLVYGTITLMASCFLPLEYCDKSLGSQLWLYGKLQEYGHILPLFLCHLPNLY